LKSKTHWIHCSSLWFKDVEENFWGCESFSSNFLKLARKAFGPLLTTNFLPQGHEDVFWYESTQND